LNLDESIMHIGIMNKYGVLLNIEQRRSITPILTVEENEEYASQSITRHKKRTKFEPKIGKIIYAFGRYKKLSRATIPINDYYYMLLMFPRDTNNFNKIIMDKVIPLIAKENNNFVE
jgi:hypothetical protein